MMRFCAFLFCILLPHAVFAGFGIAKGASTAPPPEGFGKRADYADAVNGNSILSPAERRKIQQKIRRPVNNANYFRSQLMPRSSVKVSGIKQYASPSYPDIAKKGTSDTVTLATAKETAARAYGFAFGHKGDDWRMEGEFYSLPTLQYTAHPVISTTIPAGPYTGERVNFDSKLSSKMLSVNFIRDFASFFYIEPYIGGGFGVGYQSMKTKATESGGGDVMESKTNHNICPLVNGIIGLRGRPLDRLWLDAGYRYTYIYQGARANVADVSLKSASETLSGIYVGLNLQF